MITSPLASQQCFFFWRYTVLVAFNGSTDVQELETRSVILLVLSRLFRQYTKGELPLNANNLAKTCRVLWESLCPRHFISLEKQRSSNASLS